jgi:hypothetical protein
LLQASCSVPGAFGVPTLSFQSGASDRLGDPDKDRPDVMLLTDSSEVSAPEQVLAALAQASLAPVPALALPAERLQALVLVRALALVQALVPGLASAPAPVQVPGFQPLAARPWGLRPCART